MNGEVEYLSVPYEDLKEAGARPLSCRIAPTTIGTVWISLSVHTSENVDQLRKHLPVVPRQYPECYRVLCF
ncbi:hypothetical protein A0H81_05782 [Grifola frondosa]|uniref:Uncharacterized protein n=1 Tax=Grifola frondosa TaxID=5627 RepID=A0A1C7MDT5_GRIFR|nr:hypothetical protein A0H81_05782 [Grifola frondosa]